MDSPGKPRGSIQRQNADPGVPPSLREDLQGLHLHIEALPEDLRAGSFNPGADSPADAWSDLPGGRPPEDPGTWGTKGPPRARVPPPLPRTRISTAGPPPPLPCRNARKTYVDVHSKRFSCDLSIPAHRLARSHTKLDHHDPWTIILEDTPQGSTSDLASFCAATSRLMSQFQHTNGTWNPGLVRARVLPLHPTLLQRVQISISVAVDSTPPVPLSTPVNRTVQSLIEETLQLLELPRPAGGGYILQLCDSQEVLHNDQLLGFHETIQVHCKFNQEVSLRLVHANKLERRLARDAEDDCSPCHLHHLLRAARVFNTSKTALQEVLLSYSREASQLIRSQSGMNVNVLVGLVRTLSSLLCGVSCRELEDAIGRLNRINPIPLSLPEMSECETAMTKLHQALLKVMKIFFENFQSDFRCEEISADLPTSDVELNGDILQFNIAALYKLQPAWVTLYECFSISCEPTVMGVEVCSPGVSENISTALAFGNNIHCNRMMVFPVPANQLPYECVLTFSLLGCRRGRSPELLCWAGLPVYRNGTLVGGTVLLSLSMLPRLPAAAAAAAACDCHRQAVGVILQLEFSDGLRWRYQRPVALPESLVFSPPCEELQKKMLEVSKKHCLCFLTQNEKSFLWSKRHSASRGSTFLHLLLGGAPRWRPEDLTEIYTVVEAWGLELPEEALFLLSNSFHDQTVRRAAVLFFQKLPDDDLEQFLPQLVQALRSEWELEGPLAMLLLERSVKNIRIAQQLFWLLEDARSDPYLQSWFSKVQASLRHCCGRALRRELEVQTRLLAMLVQVAEKIRASEKTRRQSLLKTEMMKIDKFFRDGSSCCLPLDAAAHVKGVDLDACKVFNSNTAPLGISFICADPLGKNISVICKTGDNLRQDMVVLQIVRMMDHVWLQEGLDLRMVTFRCLSTGSAQGLVEVVPEAVTLGKIQREWGLSGTLREDTLEKWFHMWNRTKEDYDKAVMNFIHSCAGWCVATFVLGICDRHNDNIMLKHSGHMFHIDFGRMMGNAQKFGNFKRDRSPFIFTSEMQHFITGGGQKPQRLHRFVELCCEAFNLIRRRSGLILALLELMIHAGMPELKDASDLQYVLNNLRPHDTDLEATSYFTKKIKESVGCVAVKLNFLTHSMAQSWTQEPPGLEGVPAPRTNIQGAFIQGCSVQGKDMLFDLRVTIDDGFLTNQLTFGQFELIHKQLQKHFIKSTLPPFPRWYRMSFTPGRKMSLLNGYLKKLFEGPCKGHEFVCSLFLDGPGPVQESAARELRPQIQLYISYLDCKLSVLVKHLKNIKQGNGSNPDAYVVTYLRPDPQQTTKRRTKVVRNNDNPTFNELLQYKQVPLLQGMVLEVIVKSKKTFVAATNIRLEEKLLNKETWFLLGNSAI